MQLRRYSYPFDGNELLSALLTAALANEQVEVPVNDDDTGKGSTLFLHVDAADHDGDWHQFVCSSDLGVVTNITIDVDKVVEIKLA